MNLAPTWQNFLCLSGPIVYAHAVFSLFLFTVQRTLNLVRPEHRKMTPNHVWRRLIPMAGASDAAWRVAAVARSLRGQFAALGDHDDEDANGQTAGAVWTAGLLAGFAMAFTCFAFRSAGPRDAAAEDVLCRLGTTALVLTVPAGFARHLRGGRSQTTVRSPSPLRRGGEVAFCIPPAALDLLPHFGRISVSRPAAGPALLG